MFTLELHGLDVLQRQFERLAAQAQQALAQALQAEAERILETSRYLVPIDTGLLVSTGLVERRQDGAEISYGGKGLAPYAIVQHFSTEFNHPNGGQAFYLQQPLLEATADMPQRLALDVLRGLRG